MNHGDGKREELISFLDKKAFDTSLAEAIRNLQIDTAPCSGT